MILALFFVYLIKKPGLIEDRAAIRRADTYDLLSGISRYKIK
jgi:hypothetical protein